MVRERACSDAPIAGVRMRAANIRYHSTEKIIFTRRGSHSQVVSTGWDGVCPSTAAFQVNVTFIPDCVALSPAGADGAVSRKQTTIVPQEVGTELIGVYV